jgi:molybdopterin synthase catalytic subunit
MSVRLTTEPIDHGALVEAARDPASGAVVLFLGTVRDLSEGKSVASLDYEAYPPMAEKKLAELVAQARERWSLNHACVEHRHGHLELGDVAVAVVTASGHRAEAFAAAQWIMDSIKQVVPIWKRENWADGSTEWVHPDAQRRDSPHETGR